MCVVVWFDVDGGGVGLFVKVVDGDGWIVDGFVFMEVVLCFNYRLFF